MALEANNSWMREQQKNEEQQLYANTSMHSQQRPSAKALNKQHSQTERFTQTEYRGNCVEVNATPGHKEPIMFEQTIQQHQPQAVPVQMYSTIEKKDIALEKSTNVTEFPFYNVNMLQKVHQTQAGSPTTTAVATIAAEDKSCYRFDVAQPFGYNYTLVNQMSLAAAASTATFKCDVCGLVFAHLSLLNHHKRIHNNNSSPSPERTFPSEQQPGKAVKTVKTSPAKSHGCNRCEEVQADDCEHATRKRKMYMKCESCQPVPCAPRTSTSTNGSYQSSSPERADSPTEVNISGKQLRLVKRHGHGMATVTKCHKCNGSGIILVGGTQSPVVSDKPFRCNVCDGSFSRYSSLWSHKRLHTGDKPFKCEMCGLMFARAAYLKNHVRVHSGEKPYKCNVCGMQFSQSPHLKNHERIHSGERPYQCEVCEKTFARHSTLWNHRRIHTGEKPYRCSVCGSSFNQATHLKNHAKVHTGEKPHLCDICEVGFSDRFALKRHKLIHEKYGRISKDQTVASQQSSGAQNQPSEVGEMYKCDVAFPGQQPNSSSNSQASTQDEMYKCDDSPSVAFPGASQQQSDVYKCDVGTSVSFPVQQQQAQQSTQSNNTTSEVYKVAVANNSVPFQNAQSSQKQNSSNSIGSQQTGQLNEMYKYDVAFPGQSQQAQQQTSQQTSSSSAPTQQQMSQYDVGYTGQKQQNQKQMSQQPTNSASQSSQYEQSQSSVLVPQQKLTSSTSQQVPQMPPKSLYPRDHSETILGS